MSVAVVIVAAGRGSRAGDGFPSNTGPSAGRPILTRTLEAFASHRSVASVLTVIHPDDETLFAEAAKLVGEDWRSKFLRPVLGGQTRQELVSRGLDALEPSRPNRVLIHDAARPFADPRPHRPSDRSREDQRCSAAGRVRSPTRSRSWGATRSFSRHRTANVCGRCRRRRPFASMPFWTPTAARLQQGCARSPTTARWRNGRAARACVRGRSRQRENDPSGRFRERRTAT